MLLHWGQGIFCFWAIILSVRAIVLFLSDAFVRYVLNQYNLLYHKDQQKANQTLSAGISFLIVLSFILCTLIALILLFIPTSTAFIFDIDSQHRLISLLPLCLVSYLLAASVQNIQRLYAGTKESRGLVWHNMLLEVALVVLELSALSILLFQNFDFDIIVLADSVIILLVALIYLVHLGTQYPLAHILKVSSIQQGFIQFQKATQLYASNFFEKLSTDGLVLLLSFFRFDKAAIALFATVRTLVNTPLLAQNLLLNTYTPEMQKHFALRNTDALQQLLSFIRVRIGIILLAGMVFCLPFYEPIFIFWTKGKIEFNQNFMVVMLLMAVFNLYGLSFAFVLKGVNALPQLLGLMLLKTILILIGFVWAHQDILLIAVVWAIVELLSSVFMLPQILRRYGLRQNMSFTPSIYYGQLIPYLLASLCLVLWLFFI
jgi:hypothetical protein